MEVVLNFSCFNIFVYCNNDLYIEFTFIVDLEINRSPFIGKKSNKSKFDMYLIRIKILMTNNTKDTKKELQPAAL